MKSNRAVIICTEYRGVFFGYVNSVSNLDILNEGTVSLAKARMAIYWGTTRGVMQLANTGPTAKSKISDRADIAVNKITAVFDVTDEAEKAWEAA